MILNSSKIITRFGLPGLDGSLLEIDLHDKRHSVFLDTNALPDPLIIFKQGTGFRRLNHERIPVNAKAALRFHAQPSLLEFYDPKKGIDNLQPVTVFLTDYSTGTTYELGTTPSNLLCEKEGLDANPVHLALNSFAWVAAANVAVGDQGLPVIHQIDIDCNRLHYFSRGNPGVWEFAEHDDSILISNKDSSSQSETAAKTAIFQLPGEVFRVSTIRVAVATDLSVGDYTKPPSVTGTHFVPVLVILIPTNPTVCYLPTLTLGVTLTPTYLNSAPRAVKQALTNYTYLDCVRLSGEALKWGEQFNHTLEVQRSKSPAAPVDAESIQLQIVQMFPSMSPNAGRMASPPITPSR